MFLSEFIDPINLKRPLVIQDIEEFNIRKLHQELIDKMVPSNPIKFMGVCDNIDEKIISKLDCCVIGYHPGYVYHCIKKLNNFDSLEFLNIHLRSDEKLCASHKVLDELEGKSLIVDIINISSILNQEEKIKNWNWGELTWES